MQINIAPFDDFIHRKVASGQYASPSEVVCEALRILDYHERLSSAQFDQLREDVEVGLASGVATDWNPEDIKREGRSKSQTRK